MPWFAIYKTDSGQLLSIGSVIDTDSLPSDVSVLRMQEKPDLSAMAWDSEQKTFIASTAPSIVITKLQFRRLLTFDERVAADNFEYNADLTDEVKATLRTVMADYQVAQDVTLDDPLTVNGVQFLEQVGLIGTGRAAQILANQAPGDEQTAISHLVAVTKVKG